jgi:hypothetical protein
MTSFRLPPIQMMLLGKRYETDLAAVEKLEADFTAYGVCFFKAKADGTVEHIAPNRVLAPNEEPAP